MEHELDEPDRENEVNEDFRQRHRNEGIRLNIPLSSPPRFSTDDDFRLWTARMAQYFRMIHLPLHLQGEQLLSNLDNQTWKVYESLDITPEDILTYHPLVDKLTAALEVRESLANVRFKFRTNSTRCMLKLKLNHSKIGL